MTQSKNDGAADSATPVGFLAPSGGLFIAFAGISGVTATGMAAFVRHGLDPVAQAHQIELVHTGVQMDYVHLLAMLGVAALAGMGRLHTGWATAAQWLFLAGGMLFAGNLYADLSCLHWLILPELGKQQEYKGKEVLLPHLRGIHVTLPPDENDDDRLQIEDSVRSIDNSRRERGLVVEDVFVRSTHTNAFWTVS